MIDLAACMLIVYLIGQTKFVKRLFWSLSGLARGGYYPSKIKWLDAFLFRRSMSRHKKNRMRLETELRYMLRDFDCQMRELRKPYFNRIKDHLTSMRMN